MSFTNKNVVKLYAVTLVHKGVAPVEQSWVISTKIEVNNKQKKFEVYVDHTPQISFAIYSN